MQVSGRRGLRETGGSDGKHLVGVDVSGTFTDLVLVDGYRAY
jgi:hypothetical protein